MKKIKTLIALILALLALPMCLFACEEGGADDNQTEDPNDTTEGIRVIITISGLEEKDGTRTPLLKTKDAEVFRVDPGTTLKGALDALCADREAASYEIDVTGEFSIFTYGSDKLVAEMQEQKDGSFVPVTFEVTVNGTVIEDAPNYVINHNDKIEIYLVKGESFTAKE